MERKNKQTKQNNHHHPPRVQNFSWVAQCYQLPLHSNSDCTSSQIYNLVKTGQQVSAVASHCLITRERNPDDETTPLQLDFVEVSVCVCF